MPSLDKYLEDSRLDELAREYRNKGYTVELRKPKSGQHFDLVATGHGHKIAVEVKSRSQLKRGAKQISQLRSLAKEQGFEFRLVIVNPPRGTTIEVAGLTSTLREYMRGNVPSELATLASTVSVEYIDGVTLENVTIRPGRIQVTGTATVEVFLEYGSGGEPNGHTSEADFPLTFDVELTSDLHITPDREPRIKVDTSSFYE